MMTDTYACALALARVCMASSMTLSVSSFQGRPEAAISGQQQRQRHGRGV